MKLKDYLAISGEGTLFKFIAQGKNAVIVENLETGRRFTAGTTARVSALEEISVFTTAEDIPLGKVMDRIWEKENGGETLSHKLPDAELKKYFAEVLPEYDRQRVYASDIRKVLHWYNILHKLNLLEKEEPETREEPSEEVEPVSDGIAEAKGTELASDKKTKEKKAAVEKKVKPEPKASAKKSGAKKSSAGK